MIYVCNKCLFIHIYVYVKILCIAHGDIWDLIGITLHLMRMIYKPFFLLSDVTSSILYIWFYIDLECGEGYFTNISILECQQCEKGSYQPMETDTPELCFPCALGVTTAGTGAFGLEEELCIIADPDGMCI